MEGGRKGGEEKKKTGREKRKEGLWLGHFVGYYINNEIIERRRCKRPYKSSRAMASKIFLAATNIAEGKIKI